MNAFRRICALILGMVFLVSSLLKIMDPLGSSLIVNEYLGFLHLGFLKGWSRFLSLCSALLEGVTGAALISGTWRKITGMVSGALLLFFTFLTVILYIRQPAMDCGCFGEAIHLTHAQSLLKNLILDALWCLAFIPFRDLGGPQRIKYVSFSVAAVSLVLFMLYSILSIPLRDYATYRPGTELDEHPLFFSDANMVYADSLASEGAVMVVSVYDTHALEPGEVSRIAEFASQASAAGFTPLVLLSSTPEDASESIANPTLLTRTFFADRKELMTLNRSNGGVTYIYDGQVIRKWASRNRPGQDELAAVMQQAPMDCMIESQNRTRALFQGFSLYLFAVLLLL